MNNLIWLFSIITIMEQVALRISVIIFIFIIIIIYIFIFILVRHLHIFRQAFICGVLLDPGGVVTLALLALATEYVERNVASCKAIVAKNVHTKVFVLFRHSSSCYFCIHLRFKYLRVTN